LSHAAKPSHPKINFNNLLRQADLPEHPGLKKGRLSNGLRYAILSNAAPAGRFDAYLEIFAGSADELDSQQGMAHIVEHISYMGSRKR
jgi:predicted Zn-dependent peptidase